MDGYGSGGNVATDLMRFLLSADEVRQQKDLDLLAAFDFRKRVPHVIFTADYSPTGKIERAIVSWKKIPDASGYVVKRRSVFENTENIFQFGNVDLISQMEQLGDYIRAYVLTFYDTINSDSVWAFLDKGVSPDQYYLY